MYHKCKTFLEIHCRASSVVIRHELTKIKTGRDAHSEICLIEESRRLAISKMLRQRLEEAERDQNFQAMFDQVTEAGKLLGKSLSDLPGDVNAKT